MSYVRFLFNKENENTALRVAKNAAVQDYCLVRNTYTAQNKETITTLTIYYPRPTDSTTEKQGYSNLGISRFAYHKTKGWITPTDESLEEYIAKKEILPYTPETLKTLIEKTLPSQNLLHIKDPDLYSLVPNKLSDKFLKVLKTDAKEVNPANEAMIFELILTIGPLTSTVQRSLFGIGNDSFRAAQEIKKECQLLTKCDRTDKKVVNDTIDRIINTTFDSILKLHKNDSFAIKLQEILEKNYPIQSKKALNRILHPGAKSPPSSPSKTSEHKGP